MAILLWMYAQIVYRVLEKLDTPEESDPPLDW